MYIRAAASAVEVWTPAKLNLFLEVLSRREDGFHEIETLMVPVSLFDTVYFQSGSPSTSRGETQLHIVFSGDWRSRSGKHGGREHHENPEGLDQQHIPEGVDNLVVRAVELLRKHAGAEAGAKLRLVKRIPPAAGLGGGSSDAAAALLAANAGWGLGYSLEGLMPLAAELGSDVPFFLAQAAGACAAVCRGRGERLEPLDRLGGHHYVVVRPPAGLSTAEVYGNCQVADAPGDGHGVIDSLRRGRLHEAGRRLFNRLQGTAEKLSPWITRLKEEFLWLDLPGHQMSGSGASYFGLCTHGRQARRAAARLRSRGWENVYVVRGL